MLTCVQRSLLYEFTGLQRAARVRSKWELYSLHVSVACTTHFKHFECPESVIRMKSGVEAM